MRSTYFGQTTAWEKNGTVYSSQDFAGKNILDFTVSFDVTKKIIFTLGGNNIANVYPDKVDPSFTSYFNGQVPYSRNVNQFGFNGAYYYSSLLINL
jgi:iron complex outermembrane recepter protein